MIHLDAGEDKQAVEWIRKALAAREKQSSPNLDATVENLESEIAALNRLGRKNEVGRRADRGWHPSARRCSRFGRSGTTLAQ